MICSSKKLPPATFSNSFIWSSCIISSLKSVNKLKNIKNTYNLQYLRYLIRPIVLYKVCMVVYCYSKSKINYIYYHII